MSISRSISIVTVALIVSGCAQESTIINPRPLDPDALDPERAFREVELLLSIPNRDSGTPGAEEAARHIRARIAEMGVAVEIDTFTDLTPIGEIPFHNVVAEIPGGGDGLVLIGSHFDTKPGMGEGFQGANDSGSSTGLLIEMARVLKKSPALNFDVQLLFTDGEECMVRYEPNDGLHGSRHHVRRLQESGRLEDLQAVIILDMVGDKNLSITFPRNCTPELISKAFEAASILGLRDYFGLYPGAILDDHVPFLEAGVPAINFIDFYFGSAPGLNDYWHTEKDTIDKISSESLGITGRVVLELLNIMND